MGWSKARLEQVARERLAGAKLIVVANREPYIHRRRDGAVEWIRPAGGLTTALDPVMRACGGVWVAHGSGTADRETADAFGRVRVPPNDPRYVLRRVWLSGEEESGYYYGFANSTLWPLCHHVYQRPTFEPADWAHYRAVNERFAAAVLEEAAGGPALVFVQDYHFALLPRLLKRARPDLALAQFWHIPWPNAETFRVCPWADEILDGLLGNDLLGFQVQYHCNNFLETVDRTVEARVCREHFAVCHRGHQTRVRPFPISVDPDLASDYLAAGDGWEARAASFRRRYGLGDRPIVLGVDRVDYTKGIPERFWAVERLLNTRPDWAGRFHFVQLGVPSRTHLQPYRDLNGDVQDLADWINQKHGTESWRPVVIVNEHCAPPDIYALYRMAAGCVVSSLHDGMNLVAKEFIAARADEQGVLVLSRFTGAARELTEAVLVNPFDVGGLADGLHDVLSQPAEEQRRRMRKLRARIMDNNIYRWAGMLLSEAHKLTDYGGWAADEPGAAGRSLSPGPSSAPVLDGAPDPGVMSADGAAVLKFTA
ncbi:MAG TPA: trehalose-6-phosphate synthase [Gemmataceae bacterium]|jgi:trehalose 6-phosphate synthase